MSGIDPGRLNKRVVIEEERTRIPNGQGGYTTAWTPLQQQPRAWAEIIGLTSDEVIIAFQNTNRQQWRVTMRTRSDVTPKHRLRHAGRIYSITSLLPDPRAHDAMVLICETSGTS